MSTLLLCWYSLGWFNVGAWCRQCSRLDVGLMLGLMLLAPAFAFGSLASVCDRILWEESDDQ